MNQKLKAAMEAVEAAQDDPRVLIEAIDALSIVLCEVRADACRESLRIDRASKV